MYLYLYMYMRNFFFYSSWSKVWVWVWVCVLDMTALLWLLILKNSDFPPQDVYHTRLFKIQCQRFSAKDWGTFMVIYVFEYMCICTCVMHGMLAQFNALGLRLRLWMKGWCMVCFTRCNSSERAAFCGSDLCRILAMYKRLEVLSLVERSTREWIWLGMYMHKGRNRVLRYRTSFKRMHIHAAHTYACKLYNIFQNTHGAHTN